MGFIRTSSGVGILTRYFEPVFPLQPPAGMGSIPLVAHAHIAPHPGGQGKGGLSGNATATPSFTPETNRFKWWLPGAKCAREQNPNKYPIVGTPIASLGTY